MSTGNQQTGSDAFTSFWQDFLSQSGMPGMPGMQQPQASSEATKQMQRAFFDAWAKYCDEWMRSPQFCDMLKQSMDNTLAFRKQVNEFLAKVRHEGQSPNRNDVDDLSSLIRMIEDRVLTRLDDLEAKVDALASGGGAASSAGKQGGASKGKSSSRR